MKRAASGDMAVVKVTVKWGKETFTDVEANTGDSPLVFKSQLFALTGVPPDRQKVGPARSQAVRMHSLS